MIIATPGSPLEQPFVSVIIPHCNDLANLRLCLQALAAQDWPTGRFEIIVGENNSAIGLAAVRDACRDAAPGVMVVPAPIQGAGPARNAAVAAARGTILAFTDSDCVPVQDWLTQGVGGLATYDFLGGEVVCVARQPADPKPIEAFEILFNFDFKSYIERHGFTGTGNMFTTRQVFDHVGGFRTGVPEDVDWSFRARAMGYRLGYVAAARVEHPTRDNWPDFIRRWERLVAEHHGRVRAMRFGRLRMLAWAAAMPLSVPVHAVRILRSPRLPHWRARWGGIRVLTWVRLFRMRRMLALTFSHAG